MYKVILFIFLTITLSSCSSSSNLSNLSDNSAKTARYYESIGQPQAANREYKSAAKYKKQSQESEAIIFDIIWSLLFGE
jgi:hypothetical protein